MRILLLTQWFTPEPAPKGAHFADKLAALGHEVEVVTGFPNYPGGKLYDGYRIRLMAREKAGRADVTRLPLYPSHDLSILRRALNYVTFAASALFYLLFVAKRPDVIYSYHPPLSVPLAAILAGAVRRIPVVMDVQDIWPDSLVSTGMTADGLKIRLIGRLCRLCYRRAKLICVLSKGFLSLLSGRGAVSEKIRVIPNWAHDEEGLLATKPGAGPALGGVFRILFAGNMGPAQDIATILDAAEYLLSTQKQVGTSIEFVLLGDGVALDESIASVQKRGLSNVRFLPRVPPEVATAYIAEADALLVYLRNDPIFRITIPSKIQTYLCAGRPIICGVEGDAAQIVSKAKAGECVLPGDAAALARAAVCLASLDRAALDQMGRAGREYYLSNMSMDSAVAAFEAALSDAVRSRA